MSYRALNVPPYRRYLTEFDMIYEWLNGGIEKYTEGKTFVYSVRKCNNITNNSKKQNSGK